MQKKQLGAVDTAAYKETRESTYLGASKSLLANSAAAPMLEKIRTTLSNPSTDATVAFLPGRNLLLRRDTFAKIGGFPEHLVTCEDYWFTGQAAKLGSLWYSSRASYVHLGEDREYLAMFRKEIWRGQSNIASLAGRSIGLSEWPSFLVPPGILMLIALVPVLALLGKPALAVICLTLALIPFLAYVTRLYFLGKSDLALGSIVAFYGLYFPARAYGSLLGVFRALGNSLHDR